MSEALLARQIKKSEDVHGLLSRTYCARYDNCLILIFEDGRWAHYRADADYDGDKTIEFESHPPDWEELLHAGLMTNDEYLAQRERELGETQERVREQELAMLAKLKAKYES